MKPREWKLFNTMSGWRVSNEESAPFADGGQATVIEKSAYASLLALTKELAGALEFSRCSYIKTEICDDDELAHDPKCDRCKALTRWQSSPFAGE